MFGIIICPPNLFNSSENQRYTIGVIVGIANVTMLSQQVAGVHWRNIAREISVEVKSFVPIPTLLWRKSRSVECDCFPVSTVKRALVIVTMHKRESP
jgi:hypothetical protein